MPGPVTEGGLWSSGKRLCLPVGCQDTTPLDVSVFSLLCVQELLGEKDIWDRAASLALPAAAGSGQPPCRVLCKAPAESRQGFSRVPGPGGRCLWHLSGEGLCQSSPWPLLGVQGRVAPCSGTLHFPKPAFFSPLNSRALLWIAFVGVLLPSVS